MEDKTRNSKYLCSLFILLAFNSVICYPAEQKLCTIPPELVKSFFTELDSDIKNCQEEGEIIKFCSDIRQLASDISNCNLGKLWEVKELQERLINSSRKMPVDENGDVCINFGHLSKIIKLVSTGDEAAAVQLSKSPDVCNEFCNSHSTICPLLLKLYWIKNVLTDVKNEIGKPGDSSKILRPPKDNTSRNQVTNSVPESSQNTKSNKLQTPNVVLTTKNSSPSDKVTTSVTKKDKSTLDVKADNKKLPAVTQDLSKNTINNHATLNEHKSSPLNKEISDKLSTSNNNNGKEQITQSDKSTANHQTKDDAVVTNANKMTESKLVNTPSDPANNNNPTSLDSFDKKEHTDDIDKKVTDLVADKTSPDNEPKDLPNPIKDSPSEFDNVPSPDSEKSDKTEISNQPNDFGEGFPDPANGDYEEEELPPTVVTVGKIEDKMELDKKVQVPVPKGKTVGSVFPEEEDSHFFAYFLTIVVLCIAGYLVFHNKQKIIALIIEGRHERRRRPNGGYKRLDNKDNSKSSSQVIF